MAIKGRTVSEVREAYSAYTPPFDVADIIRDLLNYVPVEYFRGLKCIVLLNASGLSRRDRRRRIPSRGKTYPPGRCLGIYRHQCAGQPAHIAIHVDRVIQQAPRLALRVSVYRDSIFARVLCHELGHPIHRTMHPQHREPENVANAWEKQLRSALLQRKYHTLTEEEWQRVRDVAAKIARRRRRPLRADVTA